MRTETERWLAEAQALLDHHNDARALIPLERVLRQTPTGSIASQAWRLKSEALEHLGHIEQALDAATHAVALVPKHIPEDAGGAIQAFKQRAHIYDLLKRYPEALGDTEHALEIAPNDLRLWIMLSAFQTHVSNHKAALSAAEQALLLNRDSAEAWHRKALALYNLKQWEAALTAFEHAMQITPHNAPTYIQIQILVDTAIALDRAGRASDALALVEQALHRDTASTESRSLAWGVGGDILVGQQRYAEALTHYDEALALTPEDARVWDAKGVVLYRLNRPKAALAAYDEAVHLDPSHGEFQQHRRYALARLLLAQRPRLASDAPAFTEVDDPEVWMFELRRLASSGLVADAEAALDQLLRLDPTKRVAYLLKALAQLRQKQWRRALATFGDVWQAPRQKRRRERAQTTHPPHQPPTYDSD